MTGGAAKADAKLGVKSKGAEKKPVRGSKSKAAKPKTIGDLYSLGDGPGPDPNMPKRPHCAFYIFLEEFRREFQEQNSGKMHFTAVSKAAGRRWKALGKEGQAAYEADAKQRMREYKKAMAAYKGESPPTSEDEEEVKQESARGSKGKATKPKTVGDLYSLGGGPGPDPNMPKRPHCAFYIFLEEFRREFQEQNSGKMHFTAVSKAAGRRWKALGKEGQATYQADAKQRMHEYKKAMAAYKGESPPTSEDEEEVKEESDKP